MIDDIVHMDMESMVDMKKDLSLLMVMEEEEMDNCHLFRLLSLVRILKWKVERRTWTKEFVIICISFISNKNFFSFQCWFTFNLCQKLRVSIKVDDNTRMEIIVLHSVNRSRDVGANNMEVITLQRPMTRSDWLRKECERENEMIDNAYQEIIPFRLIHKLRNVRTIEHNYYSTSNERGEQ